MRLVLVEPDIAGNCGAIMRLAAALGLGLDLVGPLGFILSDRRLARAAMDYRELAAITRHDSWAAFQAARGPGRLILFTSQGAARHCDFAFAADDHLLFGSESAGAPQAVHDAADARLRIPLLAPARSLNVAQAAALAAGEALRQTGGFSRD